MPNLIIYTSLYSIIITRQYSTLILLLLRDRSCFNLNGAFRVQTKETEIPNSAEEAKTVIANIQTPEQFKIHILISVVSAAVEKSQCFSLSGPDQGSSNGSAGGQSG